MTELVTRTTHDDLTVDQRRTLARFEAATPARESFDGATEIRRVLALLDELAGRWHGTPLEAGVREVRDGVRALLGVRSE